MIWLIVACYLLAAAGFYIWMVKRAVMHDEVSEAQIETKEQKKKREEQEKLKPQEEDELEEDQKAA